MTKLKTYFLVKKNIAILNSRKSYLQKYYKINYNNFLPIIIRMIHNRTNLLGMEETTTYEQDKIFPF